MNPHMTIDCRNLTTRTGEFRIRVTTKEGSEYPLILPCHADSSMREPGEPPFDAAWCRLGPEPGISMPGGQPW